jgi:hypothetical protein
LLASCGEEQLELLLLGYVPVLGALLNLYALYRRTRHDRVAYLNRHGLFLNLQLHM